MYSEQQESKNIEGKKRSSEENSEIYLDSRRATRDRKQRIEGKKKVEDYKKEI